MAMGPNLPVSVRFGPRPPGVVIDAAFALSPMGLLVTMALSRSASVWLPRGLYTLLDNDTHYLRRPEEMGGAWLDPQTRTALLAEMARELEPWRRAWQNGRLSSRVHWIGDAQYESVLPDREESGLLPRFEICCAALGARLGDLSGPVAPLDECARDVVALAAALQPETTYILTPAGPPGGAPPLCGFLSGIGFAVRPSNGRSDWADAAFAPALAPLAASGSGAAVVQVAAPVILALPDGWSEADWAAEDVSDAGEDSVDDLWRHACALWRPLAPLEAAA
jgi:hypothetical protein